MDISSTFLKALLACLTNDNLGGEIVLDYHAREIDTAMSRIILDTADGGGGVDTPAHIISEQADIPGGVFDLLILADVARQV